MVNPESPVESGLKGFCRACGKEIDPRAAICVHCGVATSTAGTRPADASDKSWLVALLLSVFLGGLAIDRFYVGRIGSGILKLVTLGGLGVWWLIDVIIIAAGGMRDGQGKRIVQHT